MTLSPLQSMKELVVWSFSGKPFKLFYHIPKWWMFMYSLTHSLVPSFNYSISAKELVPWSSQRTTSWGVSMTLWQSVWLFSAVIYFAQRSPSKVWRGKVKSVLPQWGQQWCPFLPQLFEVVGSDIWRELLLSQNTFFFLPTLLWVTSRVVVVFFFFN